MGSTASGGLRGVPRVQARPLRSRPSRRSIGPARVVLAVVAVAGFVVAGWQLFGAPARPAVAAAPDAAGTSTGYGMDLRHPLSLAADTADALSRGSPDAARLAAAGSGSPVVAAGDVPASSAARGAGSANSIASAGGGSLEPEQLTGYIWPLKGARITTWFQDTPDGFIIMRGKRIHDGLDIATFCGHRVVAAHSGTVLYAGREFGPFIGFDGPLDAFYAKLRADHDWMRLPRVVVIDDGNGYRSAYVHLGSHNVLPGQVVRAGQVIGKEGATGRASGCHLHYMLIRMDGPLVPVAPELVDKWHYPQMVRERVDPLRVLKFDMPGAARRIPGIDPPAIPYRLDVPREEPTPGADPARPQPLVQVRV